MKISPMSEYIKHVCIEIQSDFWFDENERKILETALNPGIVLSRPREND